jgi:hypothetical protein
VRAGFVEGAAVKLRTVLFVTLLSSAGCTSNGPPVEIVVPNGFTGVVWIVVDPSAPEIPLVNGRYQVVIPAIGVLKVQSLKPFQRWHSQTARYQDGAPLPDANNPREDDPETIAVRGGGWRTNGRKEVVWYFVGSAKQYNQYTELPVFHEARQIP